MKNVLYSISIKTFITLFLVCIFYANSVRTEEVQHRLQPVMDKYDDGKYEEARKDLKNWINIRVKYIKGNDLRPADILRSLSSIIQAVNVASLYENQYFGSLNETNIKRQFSIEFVRSLIDTMEDTYLIASNKGACKINSKRDKVKADLRNKMRSMSIISYIQLSKSNTRSNIYNLHKELLEGEGITIESIQTSLKEKTQESKKKEVIKAAEDDINSIRSVLKTYYNSLLTGDFTSKRSHFSKKNTDKDLKKLEDEYKHERDVEKDFDSIESVEFNDETTIRVIDAKNNHIVVRIENVIITLKKDGKTINVSTSDKFKMLKEDNRWVIWKSSTK
jgi:hypothetical protein